jgi:hypothetical protein
MIRILLFFLIVSFASFAQTGIGTTTPDASAKLDVSSTNKGFLPPRIALTALNSASPVTSPATGLLIFNSATAGSIPNQVTPGYYYWDGVNAKWVRLEDKADNLGNHTATINVKLNGNYLSNDGGSEGISVDNSGNVGLGTNTPTARLNIAGGGIRIASGMNNTSTRPSVNTSTVGNYEIRGVGGGSPQIDGQDDGFLRLSAGGGTNAIQQSSIDLSGYSGTVPDMSSNIVMRTAGTERVRINNSGTVSITGKLNVSDASGNVVTKVASYVNTDTYISLDNIKAACTRNGAGGGYGGLSIGAVNGTFNASISGTYGGYGGGSGWSNYNLTYTTTGSNALFGWGFGTAGDGSTYLINDLTNLRVYRVTLLIGYGFFNNVVSIERLL